MRKLNTSMVVIGDCPEAHRVRQVLEELGITVLDPSSAYKHSEPYGAIFFTDAPLMRRRSRLGTVRASHRMCCIRRTTDELKEAGVSEIPQCVGGAEGIVVFSATALRGRIGNNPNGLRCAVYEVTRLCARFRNQRINAALQDAALERKNRNPGPKRKGLGGSVEDMHKAFA